MINDWKNTHTLDDYGNGNAVALGAGCPTTSNSQLLDRAGILGKETERGTGFRCRGNVTKEERGVGGSVVATSQRQFDIAGNVVKIVHPQVRTGASSFTAPETLIGYGDSYTSSPAGPTFAFPTSITHPGGLTTSAQYHYGLGALAQFTDPNAKVTSYTYGANDALDRLTSVTHPIGQTIFEYEPLNNKVRTKKSLDGVTEIVSEKIFDGLGRDWKSVSLDSYQGANSQVSVETQYDALGRAYRVSNPTRATPNEWTTTTFDALDRPLTVTAPDGAVTRMGYSNNETLTRDPAGKWMKRVTDGLRIFLTLITVFLDRDQCFCFC